jgi:uncharacterized protein (TIGR00251 family)
VQDAVASTPEGVILRVQVTPGAEEDAFPSGYNEWREVVEARVRAPARDGEANRALLDLVARRLDVPREAVWLDSGHTASRKSVGVRGLDAGAAARALEEAST